MKKALFIFVLMGLLGVVYGHHKNAPDSTSKNLVKKFIAKTIKYPEMAKDLCIEGDVYARFIVKDDGSLDVQEIASTSETLKKGVLRQLEEIKLNANDLTMSQVYYMKFSFKLF